MSDGPGGLSWEAFKSLSLDVGSWCWGTLQGAFNEEATLSQIITDAVIGMIPLVGDVTAARDLIAVVIGLCYEPEKRKDKFQWLLLVVLVLALIPVFGGIAKGVGRLLIKAMGDVAHLVGAARAAKMADAARDIIAFLNRVGLGKAEKWLLDLKFAAYQSEIVKHFNDLIDSLIKVLSDAKVRWGARIPPAFVAKIDGLVSGLKLVRAEAAKRIPESIKELDQFLREIQTYVRTGGETTSQATVYAARAGRPHLSYADELRILEEGKGAIRSARGGLAANSDKITDVGKYYVPEAGFPDLTAYTKAGTYPQIGTFSGKIINRRIQTGETIYRVFGPSGVTHGQSVATSLAGGSRSPAFWGLGAPPSSGESWRHGAAVLDEWNRDGFMIVGTIVDNFVPACTGKIAEQVSTSISGQYLRGGGKQAMLDLPADVLQEINNLGNHVITTGTPITKQVGDIEWQIAPTGWFDVNGIHGYTRTPGPGTVQAARLGAKELASKSPDKPVEEREE